jgi:hypothetical protein
MRRILARPASWAACLLLIVAACATAGESPDGGDGDSSISVQPDADPNAPDADPNAPDANPAGGIDASTGTCPTSPCDLVEQCGCAAPQVCDLANDPIADGNACRDVLTPGTEGDLCGGVTDCAGGYVCIGPVGQRSCRKWCNDSTDCGQPRGKCLIQITAGGEDIPGAITCSSNCDPTSTAPTECPSTWGCYIYLVDPDPNVSGDEETIADCEPSGASIAGGTCADYGDCEEGHLCLGTTCRRMCDRAAPNCPGGQVCNQFNPPALMGGIEYGFCQ